MQIRTLRMRFEAFEWIFKGILTIQMEILTIPTRFKAFKRDSKHYSNHWKGILSTRMQIWTIQTRLETFKCKLSNANSNNSKEMTPLNAIRKIEPNSKHPMQLLTIWKLFKEFKCKFEHFERDLKHSNAYSKILTIQMEIPTIWTIFKGDSKHSNAISNHSKGIWSIRMQIRTLRMQIRTLRMRFEAFNFIFKWILTIQVQISTIWTRNVQMQILAIWKGFECKFEPFKPNSKHSNEKWTLRMRFEAFECIF